MLSEKLKYYKVESIARGSKMVQQRIQNASEALKRAKEMDGDVFLGSFTKEELEESGFDTSPPFDDFYTADVYLQWDGTEYQIKYMFDNDIRNTYYEREKDVGGTENLLEDVKTYLRLTQEKENREGE